MVENIYTYLIMFLETSSVHGLKYLTPKNRAISERVLWLGLIFACMCGAALFSLSTWRRYQDNPTVISMERDYRAWNTSFPSVTICPHNKYDNTSAKAENLKDVQDIIPYLFNASYENFHQLKESLPKEILPPAQYMELIINNSFKFVHNTVPEIQFTTSITEMGVCYTYLSNIAIYNSPEKWRSGSWTIVTNDNEVYGNPFEGEVVFRLRNMNSGSKVYLHNAFEMPDSSSHFMDLKYLHQLTVNVDSLTIHSTESVRSLSVSQRKCRFLEESDLHISPVYSYNFCRMQCRMDQAMLLCGCVPHFYRSKVKYPVCSFEGMRCLGRYRAMLVTLRDDEKRLCNCLPQCDDVSYVVDFKEQTEWYNGTNLVLHLSKYPRMRLKRDLIYGFTDVLVAIGASAGLFLGCSILSFVEIIYFFTLRLFWFSYNGRFK